MRQLHYSNKMSRFTGERGLSTILALCVLGSPSLWDWDFLERRDHCLLIFVFLAIPSIEGCSEKMWLNRIEKRKEGTLGLNYTPNTSASVDVRNTFLMLRLSFNFAWACHQKKFELFNFCFKTENYFLLKRKFFKASMCARHCTRYFHMPCGMSSGTFYSLVNWTGASFVKLSNFNI